MTLHNKLKGRSLPPPLLPLHLLHYSCYYYYYCFFFTSFQLLLLILGREDAIVNLNSLSRYILAIGWVRVCPGMYSSLKCVKA